MIRIFIDKRLLWFDLSCFDRVSALAPPTRPALHPSPGLSMPFTYSQVINLNKIEIASLASNFRSVS